MSEQEIIEQGTIGGKETVAQDAAPTTATLLRYLAVLCATMLLLYIAPFFLARSSAYDRVDPSYFARPLNYAFTTAGQNADVVVFGDSTALFGINPSQMSTALKLRVLNLPNTQGSLLVNDDLVLRRYLSSNRPPKLIIFYFAPWDFDYGHVDVGSRPTQEGQELLLRQGTRDEVLDFVRKHPVEAMKFPPHFDGAALQFMMKGEPVANQNAELTATRGHIDSTDRTVLKDPCSFPPFLLDHIRFDWVRSLGERYSSPQTRVMFYVAPIPSCTNVSSVLSRRYDQLPAAPPVVVPPRYFSDGIGYVHPLPFAVPELTRNLSEAVRPLLAAPQAQAQTSSVNPESGVR